MRALSLITSLCLLSIVPWCATAQPPAGTVPASDTLGVTLENARASYFHDIAGRPLTAAEGASTADQATRLLEHIRISLSAGRIIETLDTIGLFRESGLTPPSALVLLEARLAVLGQDWDRASGAIAEYLARTSLDSDPTNPAAVALSDQITAARDAYRAKVSAARLGKAQAQCRTTSGKRLRAGTIFQDCAFTPRMVVLPGGTFEMGPSVAGRPEDATSSPRHSVSIRPFAAGRYEVSFDEWAACVEGGGCGNYRPADRWGQRDQPVINVSWNDAQGYVAWLSAVTGHRYRLLSEAEWEYAARGGTSTDYPEGISITRQDANFGGTDGTVPVGAYRPNPFGLYDTQGNVWEWTQDCWHPNYEGAPDDGSAWTTGECSAHVFRGGCWYNLAQHIRANVRFPSRTGARNAITGIRVARDLDGPRVEHRD